MKEQDMSCYLSLTGCLSVLISCPDLKDPAAENSPDTLTLTSAMNLKIFGLGLTRFSCEDNISLKNCRES